MTSAECQHSALRVTWVRLTASFGSDWLAECIDCGAHHVAMMSGPAVAAWRASA